jgi:uncharacterized membrane protein YidH (DUF202 family)
MVEDSSLEVDEIDLLARLRTMLALERNYLAEERTELAEFRTGLALAFLGPPGGAVVAYLSPHFPIGSFFFDIFAVFFFVGLTMIGIVISLSSRSQLLEIRRKKKLLRERESELVRSSEAVYALLGDFII